MKILTRDEVGQVLHAIYEAEINIRIESHFDEGYHYYIGDYYRGYADHYLARSTEVEDVITEIAFRIVEVQPESSFTEYWKTKLNQIAESKRPGINEALYEAQQLPSPYK
jgi:hypothetical protein